MPALKFKKTTITAAALALCLVIVACAENAVTGGKNFLLVGPEWDREVGQQQYLPLRQMQGGDYTADPEVEAYVREVGMKLAAASDVKLPYEFNVINSSVPNAWALPSGKISINRGLLTEMNSEAELAAVLGHEIIHAASRHGARGMSKNVLAQVGVVAATVAGSREGYGQLAQMGASLGAQLITTKYGRDAELEADLYGMEYMKRAGFDVQGAVDLQRTFVKLSEGRRQDFISGLFSSHPPSEARVNANIATAVRLGAGGVSGESRYQKVMRRLNQTQPAYEKFEQAQKAYADGQYDTAKRLATEAIKIEPRDGHFYSLLGDVAGQKQQWNAAKRNYDKAISLNEELFYYFLQRGKVHQRTNNIRAAKADFQRSMALLPTEDAQVGLGDVARLSGDNATAVKFYSSAARGQSATAKYANQQLAELQFDQTPGKFLQVRHGPGQDGLLRVELTNTTSKAINNIVLEYRFGNAQTGQQSRISGSVAAGKQRIINTGTRLTAQQMNSLTVYVREARMVN